MSRRPRRVRRRSTLPRLVSVVVAACCVAAVVPGAADAAPIDESEDVLVVLPAGDGRVTYVMGESRGDGTFAWSKTSLVSVRRPLHVALGDMDGDGRDDIVAVVRDGSAWRYEIHRNSGGGRFRALSTRIVRSSKPVAIAVGRLDSNQPDSVVAAEQRSDGSYRYVYTFDDGDGNVRWLGTGITRPGKPLALRIGRVSRAAAGDLVIVEEQPDGKARYMIAIGGTRLKRTNLVNMTPPAGFDVFNGSMDDFSDVGAIERTSNSTGRLMVGEWGGPGYWGWGFTNIDSRPLAVRFAMGDVDGDTDGDGLAVVRVSGVSRVAVMLADRASGVFGWRVTGPRWDRSPLFLDVGNLD